MRLIVLGSGSSGNCYLLDGGKECLMVECGVPFFDVEKAISFNTDKICGVLVSHEHGDHAGYIDCCINAFCDCYMSRGTMLAMGLTDNTVNVMEPLAAYKIGDFYVEPFPVIHDSAQPFGFYITHKDCGHVVFATDTCSLDYDFKGVNNIMIECNYMENILQENYRNGLIYRGRMERVRHSHLSLQSCLDFLKHTDLSAVNNIILMHLSQENARAGLFQQIVARETGKNVIVAHKGLSMDFNVTPF